MSNFIRSTRILASATLPLLLAMAGCNTAMIATPPAAAINVTGNWQFSSTDVAAARLPAFSGELTGSSAAVTGIFHTDSTGACLKPSQAIEVKGATDSKGLLTLTGGDVAGGTLFVRGVLAPDGHSLTATTYTITGGQCAFAKPASGTAQAYSSIDGAYTGSFSDAAGQVITLTANLSQAPASDTSGNFSLSGTANFPNNPCFNSPVSISNSQVTGGSFQLTYADASTQNSVTANGTFSTDGTKLAVTQWTLTGACGPDTGTGALSR